MASPLIDELGIFPTFTKKSRLKGYEPPFVSGVLFVRFIFYVAAVSAGLIFPFLGYPLPSERLVALSVFSVLLGIVVGFWLRKKKSSGRVSISLSLLLIYDVAVLTFILASTGGVSNPFTMLYFSHVTLAAVCLPRFGVMLVVVGSSVGYAALFWTGEVHASHAGGDYALHLQGMWVAFAVTAIVIGGSVSRLTQALLQEREMRARAARLLGLTTLAAGAAHEIGNPLGTIKLVASDLVSELQKEQLKPWADDAQVILEEVDRARDVLRKMARAAGELEGEGPKQVYISEIVQALKERLETVWSLVDVSYASESSASLSIPLQATAQALAQLVRNGLEASEPMEMVRVIISESAKSVIFSIEDNGVGMEPSILERVGEPFFTTKDPGRGTGLGVFLARTLVEQLDGQFQLTSSPVRGTRVTVMLPRNDR